MVGPASPGFRRGDVTPAYDGAAVFQAERPLSRRTVTSSLSVSSGSRSDTVGAGLSKDYGLRSDLWSQIFYVLERINYDQRFF